MNRTLNIIQIVLLAICVVLLLAGVAQFASTIGVPNDDVGALHNLSANLIGMLLLIVSGTVFVANLAWFVVRCVMRGNKK